MKIAIDISQVIYGTGVSHYRKHLAEILPVIDSKDDYILFGGSIRRRQDLFNMFPAAKVFFMSPKIADIVWNRLHIFPVENLIGQVDVVHTSDWAEPPSAAFKVTTIHDLIPLKFPSITPSIIRETHKRRLNWVAHESRRIIVPSQNTKRDLVTFGFNEDAIRVVPEAPNLKKAKYEDIEKVKSKYKIFNDYLISIGTKPWKNTKRMVDAFHLTKYGKDLKYVVVGEIDPSINTNDRGVRFLGRVSDSDLEALVSGSRGLLFASLYEGLGIPILDAFNCEVPVITSNLSSMPEIAGDACELVDPYDVSSISKGIDKILRGPKKYILKGKELIKNYSWEKTAQTTLDVYKEYFR